MVFTIQFVMITLDLFDSQGQLEPGVNFFTAPVWLLSALLLVVYQVVRLVRLVQDERVVVHQATLILLATILLQLALFVGAGLSHFSKAHVTVEYAMFGVAILYGLLQPFTYAFVKEAAKHKDGSKKQQLSLGGATISIFCRHYTKRPLLLVLGLILTLLYNLLLTYQGKVINALTETVTATPDGTPMDSSAIGKRSAELIIVWIVINVVSLALTFVSARMFSSLEVWLRGAVFDRAAAATKEGCKDMTVADFQTRYASDISNVRALYSTLLTGIVGNLAMMVFSFVFLVVYSWQVAVVSLGVLVIAVYSGPTSLVVEATKDSQEQITTGVKLLSKISVDEDVDNLVKLHEEKVMIPLSQSLFRKFFYGDLVLNYILFFSTFLTAMVVINLTWSVYTGELSPSDLLGVFYVFNLFTQAASNLSDTFALASRKVANVDRIDEVVFFPRKEGVNDSVATTVQSDEEQSVV